VGTPQGDLTRPPLASEALAGALPRGGLWREIVVVERTGSTNADVKAVAGGAPEGLVIVAEHQTAGRGRLDRAWTAPPRSGLTFSALLCPDGVPAQRWGWLPLAAGLAVATAVSRTAGLDTRVKWPNDVLHGGRKLAGVLVERVGTPSGAAAVVGVGLNVTQREDELPTPQATSLLLAGGAVVDRADLLLAVLGELGRWYAAWRASGGDADRCGLRQAYSDRCVTLGREVRAEFPDGTSVTGAARSVDVDGALVIQTAKGPRTVAAGDVTHLRPHPEGRSRK
jgi:BirA family transcriptional regulator, biotin operon repressor / biotin---[acetyl-CoA-carboxylase] ligase